MENPVRMPRYWVIAPYEYQGKQRKSWDKVWRHDLDKGIISIGFTKLGDVSALNENQLREAVDRTYKDKPPASRSWTYRMMRDLYHSVKPGDIVIARQGLKKLAAVGTVMRAAYYDRDKNSDAIGEYGSYSNHLDIQWNDEPRGKSFDALVFRMVTIYEIPDDKFRELTQAEPLEAGVRDVQNAPALEKDVQNQGEFVLEKYLEEFIVSNFETIFKGKLRLYSDPDANIDGQQFETDVGTIDILAQEVPSNAFVVVELKKGRESDKVVGQVLRYMGWVAQNLSKQGQDVKGIVICKEPDDRLKYAMQMVKNVNVKYYRVDFKLQDQP